MHASWGAPAGAAVAVFTCPAPDARVMPPVGCAPHPQTFVSEGRTEPANGCCRFCFEHCHAKSMSHCEQDTTHTRHTMHHSAAHEQMRRDAVPCVYAARLVWIPHGRPDAMSGSSPVPPRDPRSLRPTVHGAWGRCPAGRRRARTGIGAQHQWRSASLPMAFSRRRVTARRRQVWAAFGRPCPPHSSMASIWQRDRCGLLMQLYPSISASPPSTTGATVTPTPDRHKQLANLPNTHKT